jgi:hypothetical protein
VSPLSERLDGGTESRSAEATCGSFYGACANHRALKSAIACSRVANCGDAPEPGLALRSLRMEHDASDHPTAVEDDIIV